MFFILPTHSDSQLRRWPVCTMVIIGLCALVWAATLLREHELEQQLPAVAEEAAEILGDNPQLTPSEDLAYLIADHPRAVWRMRHPETEQGAGRKRAPDELPAVEARAHALVESDLRSQFASGRSHPEIWRMLAAQYTHGSWEHLLFNAWFLWVLGIALEDRLGRWLYPLFYTAAGCAGSIAQELATPGNGIGASGAIAGVMGAFAVMLPLSLVHLRVIALLPIPITLSGRFGSLTRLLPFPPVSLALLKFGVPSALVLFLWAGVELWSGATSVNSGIGHWAHAGGFGFGVAVAAILRVSGLDKRLETAIENRGASLQNPELTAASALIDAGKPGLAIVRLRKLAADARISPIDVQLELLRAAERANSRRDEASARSALLHLYLENQGPVTNLLDETRARGLEPDLPPELRARLSKYQA